MLRSVCLRGVLDLTRLATESLSAELENRLQATVCSVGRVGSSFFAKKRPYSVYVSSSLGTDQQNGTAVPKSDLPPDQVLSVTPGFFLRTDACRRRVSSSPYW